MSPSYRVHVIVMEQAFRKHGIGAHQTNKDDELCVQNVLCVQDDVLCVQGPVESSSVGNGLDDSNSYVRKVQVMPNDVADATAVCSRDSLKLSRQSLKSSEFRKSSMCLKSSEFRKSSEFFKVLRVSDSNQATCENKRLKIQGDRGI